MRRCDAVEAAHDAGIAAVAARQGEIGEQLGDALIEHGAVVAAGLVAEGAGKPTFADAGRPAQDQIVVRVDPFAADELVEQRAVEAARGTVIDVLDDGLLAQPGIAQPGGEPLVAAMGDLAIEEQAKPFGVGQARAFAGGFEFGEGLGHAGKPELGELIEGRMGEQRHSPNLMVVARPADIGMQDRHSVGGRLVSGRRSSLLARIDRTEP